MSKLKRHGVTAAVIGAVCILVSGFGVGLSGASASGAGTPGAGGNLGASAKVNWSMAGFNLQHTNYNPFEKTLGVSAAPHLAEKWSTSTGGPYSNTSPVVAKSVRVGSKTESLLYAGNEEGDLVALNALTGSIVWKRTLGSELGGPKNPACYKSRFGITDSPVLDLSTNTLYVVDGLGHLWALNMSTGQTRNRYPIRVTSDYLHEHVWSSLNLTNGKIYIPIASECDDGSYYGRIVVVSVAKARIVQSFYVNGRKGAVGAAIWGWDGVSFDSSGQHIYLATGNDTGAKPNAGLADSVIELDASSLKVVGHNNPGIPGPDSDFGTTPVLYQAKGCPAQLAVENKDGDLYVYDQGHLGSGPVQVLRLATQSSQDFIGDVAWSPADDLLFVSDGAAQSPYVSGLLAFTPVKAGTTCDLRLSWETAVTSPTTVVSPPVVADGVVYYADGAGDTVTAFQATTGKVLFSFNVGNATWTSPVVVNGWLYAVDWFGKVDAFSP